MQWTHLFHATLLRWNPFLHFADQMFSDDPFIKLYEPDVEGGHSHMLMDINFLSLDPHFLCRSYTQWLPFLFSPYPMTPFFCFCIKFYIQIANFGVLCTHFEKFNNFTSIINIKFANFGLKFHFLHTEWPDPHFWESTLKKRPNFFFVPSTNDPFFLMKSYTQCQHLSFSGRHMYVTFIFEHLLPPHDVEPPCDVG